MTWPVDKLAIINDALIQCGATPRNVAEDGSDEWTVGSSAYEAALPYCIEGHDWKFATLVATPAKSGTAPTDDQFTDAYFKPADLLHLIWVRLDDAPVNYIILNNQIALSANGGAVTIKYVRAPTMDAVTPMFAMGLRAFVISGLYRGLRDDTGEADKMWAMGEKMMQMARTRSDQEAPKRAMFNSRITAARRIRRPWPPVPTGWSGTGTPG